MRLAKLVTAIWLVVTAQPAAAQASPALDQVAQARAADAIAVWHGGKPFAQVFAPVFVAAIPEDRFRSLGSQLETQFGTLKGVDSVAPQPAAGTFRIALRFERAIAHGEMHLEATAPFRIDGFRLSQFDPLGDNADKIVADLRKFPGVTTALLAPLEGGVPLLAFQPDRELAIGSTMKLYVLSALAHQIAAGQRHWGDVVTLREPSLPSGQMQDWPRDAPVTLATLATMMISISDNTATDTLITLVGQAAIDTEMVASHHAHPESNRPFLTTRQVFQLKGGDDTALQAYPGASPSERGRRLSALPSGPLDGVAIASKIGSAPRAIGVEWFASSRDLAGILDRLRALPDPTTLQILAVNPGIRPRPAGFDYVGYKGGSEPGVLNLSWLLKTTAGKWYVATLGWNNPAAALKPNTLELFYSRLLALVPKD
ncbi:MAG: serine hydrolase [Croceibacterium sp.]